MSQYGIGTLLRGTVVRKVHATGLEGATLKCFHHSPGVGGAKQMLVKVAYTPPMRVQLT